MNVLSVTKALQQLAKQSVLAHKLSTFCTPPIDRGSDMVNVSPLWQRYGSFLAWLKMVRNLNEIGRNRCVVLQRKYARVRAALSCGSVVYCITSKLLICAGRALYRNDRPRKKGFAA